MKSKKDTKESHQNDKTAHCGYFYGDEDDPLIEDEWNLHSKCGHWASESCGNVNWKTFMC